MATLRLDVGPSPLRTEHERLLRTALRRGEPAPEIEAGARVDAGAYSPLAIRIAEGTWRERMRHEHHSSCVFSRLLPQLIEAEAGLEYKTSVLRMAMDELHHAALCASVVRYLGGDPAIETSLVTEPLPEHPGRSPRERLLRNVLFVSCLSETIATALLAEERERAREPRIARVVEQLSADESLHARLGWSLLGELGPSLDAEERAGIGRYLPIALGSIEAKMHGAMPLGPALPAGTQDELAALGSIGAVAAREILGACLEEVIVPRLEELGWPARSAWKERRAR